MTTETVHNPIAAIRNRAHPNCVVCSFTSGRGVHLKFYAAQDASVTAALQCDETFDSYPGVLNGW